jgi:hypothetical protein
VTHAYLGYNIVAILKQFMAAASLNQEMLGTDSTFCINKAVLSSGCNDLDHISENINRHDNFYWTGLCEHLHLWFEEENPLPDFNKPIHISW